MCNECYMYLRPEIQKKLPKFYLFKQNVQAQMQAIFENQKPEVSQSLTKRIRIFLVPC